MRLEGKDGSLEVEGDAIGIELVLMKVGEHLAIAGEEAEGAIVQAGGSATFDEVSVASSGEASQHAFDLEDVNVRDGKDAELGSDEGDGGLEAFGFSDAALEAV